MTVVVSALWVVSAVWVPEVPEMVGVVELWKAAGAVTVGAGGATSTTTCALLLVATLVHDRKWAVTRYR